MIKTSHQTTINTKTYYYSVKNICTLIYQRKFIVDTVQINVQQRGHTVLDDGVNSVRHSWVSESSGEGGERYRNT